MYKKTDFELWYEDHKQFLESDSVTRKGLARLVWGTAVVWCQANMEDQNKAILPEAWYVLLDVLNGSLPLVQLPTFLISRIGRKKAHS